jgi:hypothetical protein
MLLVLLLTGYGNRVSEPVDGGVTFFTIYIPEFVDDGMAFFAVRHVARFLGVSTPVIEFNPQRLMFNVMPPGIHQ